MNSQIVLDNEERDETLGLTSCKHIKVTSTLNHIKKNFEKENSYKLYEPDFSKLESINLKLSAQVHQLFKVQDNMEEI